MQARLVLHQFAYLYRKLLTDPECRKKQIGKEIVKLDKNEHAQVNNPKKLMDKDIGACGADEYVQFRDIVIQPYYDKHITLFISTKCKEIITDYIERIANSLNSGNFKAINNALEKIANNDLASIKPQDYSVFLKWRKTVLFIRIPEESELAKAAPARGCVVEGEV